MHRRTEFLTVVNTGLWLVLCALALLPVRAMAQDGESAVEAEPAGKSAKAPDRVKILVMDMVPNNVDAGVVKTLTDLVTVALSEVDALEVISGEQLRQVINLETQKQLIDAEDNSALSKVAEQYGADYVIFGRTGKLGKLYFVNLTLLKSSSVSSVASKTVEVEFLEEFNKVVKPAVYDLIRQPMAEHAVNVPKLKASQITRTALTSEAKGEGPSVLPWIVAGLGGVTLLAGAGVALASLGPAGAAQTALNDLNKAESNYTTAESDADRAGALDQADVARANYGEQVSLGNTLAVSGLATAGTGVLVLGAGALWALLSAGGDEAAESGGEVAETTPNPSEDKP